MSIQSLFYSSQQNELSIGHERLPDVSLFYCDGSSDEARKNQQQSEDFLAYQYSQGEAYFAFILCDGVGQSIDSGYAARMFGQSMVQELPKIGREKREIEKYANQLREVVASEINKRSLDSQNDPFYAFNSRLRKEVGSQVKFACGLIDFYRKEFHIYWAGDIHFILFGKDENITKIWREDNNQLWSTKPGTLTTNSIIMPLDDISRVFVSSDGIKYHFDEILTNKKLIRDSNLIEQVYNEGRDDISVLDIKIGCDAVERLKIPQAKIIGNTIFFDPSNGFGENRLYFLENGVVEEILDLPIKQGSFVIPIHLSQKEIEVQALSSDHISSEKSLPISRVVSPTDTKMVSPYPISKPTGSTQVDIKPPVNVQATGASSPSPSIGTNLPEISPNSPKKFVIIFILFLLGVSVIAIGWNAYSFYAASASARKSTPVVSITMTPHKKTKSPTFTPFSIETATPASTMATVTLLPSETNLPLSTALQVPAKTPDPRLQRLNECQQAKVSEGWVIYEVKSGDNFYALARILGISSNDLMNANCYPNSLLHVGALLVIPNTSVVP